MRITLVQPLEELADQNTQDEEDQEKQHSGNDHLGRLGIRIFHTNYKGQYNDPDHIVNDRSTHNGGSGFCFKIAQLLQGGNCNTYRGGCQDHSGKDGRVKSGRTAGSKTIIAAIKQISAKKRYQYS